MEAKLAFIDNENTVDFSKQYFSKIKIKINIKNKYKYDYL